MPISHSLENHIVTLRNLCLYLQQFYDDKTIQQNFNLQLTFQSIPKWLRSLITFLLYKYKIKTKFTVDLTVTT